MMIESAGRENRFRCVFVSFFFFFSSMDRAASILFPIESRRFCHRRMANLITIVLVCILTLLNSHLFYGFFVLSMRSITNEQISICHHRMDSERYRKLFSIYDSYVDVIKTNIIPFIIMTICNIIIIVRVCRSNPQMQLNHSSASISRYRTTKSKKKLEKDRQLTLMLVGSAIAFLVLTLPTEINDIIRSHSQDSLVNEKSYLLSAILLSLAHLNYAVCLSSSLALLQSDRSMVNLGPFLYLYIDWRSFPPTISQTLANQSTLAVGCNVLAM